MVRLRLFALLTALVCCVSAGISVSAAEVDCDDVYCFSSSDFAGEDLTGLCITGLPEASVGAVKLGDRVLRPGDILAADQIGMLTFAPSRTEQSRTAEICYLPVFEHSVGQEAVMTLSIRGKEDQAPVAEDSAGETYKNLPLEGKLKVKEPEEQAMTFAVTRQPKRGTVEIGPDGSFTYTPKKNKVGVDSFVYTATDENGNISREAKVTITILKPADATQYTDTVGKPCRFAAEWMKNTGIFVGEKVGGNACFSPEEVVTRGEFVTMLVKTLDMEVDGEWTTTHYTDEVADWLRPYLAAAVRSGLTAGLPNQEIFGSEEPITGAEAAVMLQNALDFSVEEVAVADASVAPEWAREALLALNGKGFALGGEETMTRSDAAQALYRANLLFDEAPGMQVLRMQ